MESEIAPQFSVSQFLAVVNQSLEIAFGLVEVEGEVASFKVNHQKYVFFDLKDDDGSVGCFMTVWQLKNPIEDGMRVIIRAVPKLTSWGKFSLTVESIRPVGQGSIRRAEELLKQKLEKEGLFASERKRVLPRSPSRIGVISSTDAAGYRDFIKILNERWAGVEVEVAHVQVQGDAAPGQIVRAIEYFNSLKEVPEVLVIIRGGGAADDLAAFSSESVVRAVATSRVPTLVGVGHETDQTLSDLAADVRASTPTHAAQIVVPSHQEVLSQLQHRVNRVIENISERQQRADIQVEEALKIALHKIDTQSKSLKHRLRLAESVIYQLDPRTILVRGYALVRDEQGKIVGRPQVGQIVKIETNKFNVQAEVKHVEPKTN